jgi:hypothetical protein
MKTFDLKKYLVENKLTKTSQLDENQQYLINAKYTVPENWFGSPLEVLKTNIFSLKKDNIISSGEIKNVEYDNDNFIAQVTFVTNDLSKPEFLKKLQDTSTRVEQWDLI